MTTSASFSKLSMTLDSFNNTLNESDKLDGKALQTIQNYLNNPQITTLDGEDQEKVQHPLQQLEKLREQAILARTSSNAMKKINYQLKDLAELIVKNSEETLRDAYFTIVKLEVCFLDLLSEDAANSSKHWQKLYEEKMTKSEVPSQSAHKALHASRALYLDRQQRLKSELMNAALFDVMEYFEEKEELFSEHFTQQLLDSFNEKISNQKSPLHNKMSDDVFTILSRTSELCELSISDLIYHLKYALIEFGEQMNEFARPLQNYIHQAKSPTLTEFNQTIDPSLALTPEEVDQFIGLFELYCNLLLSPPQEMSPSLLSDVLEESSNTSSVSKTAEAQDIAESFVQPSTIPKIADRPLMPVSESRDSSTLSKEKSLSTVTFTSVSAEKITQPELPPPPIESESDVKFIWIESDDTEDYYQDYLTTISPASSIHYKAAELISQIPDDWINSRIFLCLSARNARDLLPRMHLKVELYRVYLLCSSKLEEDEFSREEKRFGKIRVATSDKKAFIRQLALDIIPSFIEIGDIYLETNEFDNAHRWFRSTLEKINQYDNSKEKFLVPVVMKKLAKCSRQ